MATYPPVSHPVNDAVLLGPKQAGHEGLRIKAGQRLQGGDSPWLHGTVLAAAALACSVSC